WSETRPASSRDWLHVSPAAPPVAVRPLHPPPLLAVPVATFPLRLRPRRPARQESNGGETWILPHPLPHSIPPSCAKRRSIRPNAFRRKLAGASDSRPRVFSRTTLLRPACGS